MKRVLLVGGSRHGQWMEVDRTCWNIRVAREPDWSATWDAGALGDQIDILTDIYHIERVPIEFQQLRTVVLCGIYSDLSYNSVKKSRAVVSAIFQRDIADMFREDPWSAWG